MRSLPYSLLALCNGVLFPESKLSLVWILLLVKTTILLVAPKQTFKGTNQRIYVTNRTEMPLLYALGKVNNRKCTKG